MCTAVIFLQETCIIQQNVVNFEHMLSVMNYLSFISLDTIEALFFPCSLFCHSCQINEL